MIRLLLTIALALCLGAPGMAAETRRALLVGVSDYLADAVPDLQGPRNDVALVHQTLKRHWGATAEITVLADGMDPAAFPAARPPTGAAIRAGLAALAEASHAGDEVLIYMAGHGSQIPAPAEATAERDRMDEVFLPRDFALAVRPDTIEIGNYLLDDEIGAAVAQIAAKGAFVWLVIDACHSGTMERSGGAPAARFVPLLDGTRRVVDLTDRTRPVALPGAISGQRPGTVSGQRPGAASNAASIEVVLRRGGGGFAGFYAAAPDEIALEVPLPLDGAASQVHGVLTWGLVQAIRQGSGATYEALAQSVAHHAWSVGGLSAVPLFAGNLSRAAMVGTTPVESFPLIAEGGAVLVGGGVLDGLAPGTEVTLHELTAPEAAPLARGTVTEAGLERAHLTLRTGDRPLSAAELRWVETQSFRLRARIATRPVGRALRVRATGAAEPILRQLGQTMPVLQPVAPGAPADLRLTVAEGRLWLADGVDPLDPVRAFSVAEQDLEGLATALRRRHRSLTLLDIAHRFRSSPLARDLVLRPWIATPERPVQGPCAAHPSGEPKAPAPDARLVDGTGPIPVAHCSRVYLELHNRGAVPLDVSPFYFGPQGRIYYLRGYRDATFFGLRVEPGARRIVSYTETTLEAPAGRSHLVFFAVAVRDGAKHAADFRHLEDAAPPAAPTQRAGQAAEHMAALLQAASTAPTQPLRRIMGGGAAAGGALVVPLDVAPANLGHP